MDLLFAAKELINKGYKINFNFAGSFGNREFKKEFFAYIEKNNLSKYIIYHGIKIGKEKNRLFSNANIFVFPTYYDSFPLSILEAMRFS